ncbi:monofunctional biosynthetic peptidoglycan transglycosylase [Kushneria aurantia]|uniref:Biosynthetic peptidoglycan transglycosylase n=1 Tax=Kushneria aurantia TaxID=504092 RepID=A0ABV6G4T4_9GAMM|nr:monofunctional biosynthetic peptidoglycan transglycosylase [Kushneria aurantia]
MREWIGWLGYWALRILLGAMLVSILLVALFRFVPLPGSMVMLERWAGARLAGEPFALHYRWTPWQSLSDEARLAVIAAEDQNFPNHFGFDFGQIRDAIQAWREGRTLRGASTISQQTAKNVFLWSDRSVLRKGLEVWFTFLIELIWPKQRILEVYLNVAEWDRGVFGLDAAAEHYFGIRASQVSADRAARLAAVLPNPLEWSPLHPNAYVQGRIAWIRQQMRQLGGVGYLQRL